MNKVVRFGTAMVMLLLAGAATLSAATLQEDFANDPAARGWRVFGETNLFQWNAPQQSLAVTWDSSQPNSYFYCPLGTILSRDDDFSLAFDLCLTNIGIGSNTNKAYAFELAVGFLNLENATKTNFLRGTGTDSPDLVEFDYFWDAGYGATVWPVCISSNSAFNYNGSTDYALATLTNNTWYHVVMTYLASTQTLVTTLTNLSQSFGLVIVAPLATNFTDFRVDTVAVSSYSDAGDSYDSILAQGAVDNVVVNFPPPPVTSLAGSFSNHVWQAQFTSRSHWRYTLERTVDFQTWSDVSPTSAGNGGTLVLQDTHPPAAAAFYRVRADKP